MQALRSRFGYLSKVGVALVGLTAVGDLLTTYVGVVHLGATELNPVAAHLYAEYGFVAFIVLKAIAFGVYVWIPSVTSTPERYYTLSTYVMALPWGASCILNLTTLAFHVAGNGV